MAVVTRPFTETQVADAKRTYGEWWWYYFGGTHPFEKVIDPVTKVATPLYEKATAKHFLRFVNEVVFTLDEDDPEHPVKPFPRNKAYIEYYVRNCLFGQRFIVIPKSRRLMMTWIHAVYCLWFALAYNKRNVVWQAQKGDKVADTMENKILHVLRHLPLDRFAPFVDYNDPKVPSGWDERVINWYRGKRESYGLTRITFLDRALSPTGQEMLEPGSRIFGVPEGEDQTRQYTISLFVGDEFGFWKRPKASLKGIRPALGKTGQGILISSASPGYMAELMEHPSRPLGEPDPPQPTPMFEGIKTWYSNQGWFVHWTHYTADEEKRGVDWTQWPDYGKQVNPGDPGYARLGMGKRQWLQEFEIDMSIHQGEPFYPEYSDALNLQPVRAIPNQPIILGFDFGLTPATVICQLTRSGHLNVVDEFVSDDNGIRQHGELLVHYLDAAFPWWRSGNKKERRNVYDEDFLADEQVEMITSYVDPAGFQRSQTDMKTPIEILKELGFNPVGSVQDPVTRSEAVRELLTRTINYPERDLRLPSLLVNPRAKVLVEGLRGGAKQGKIRFKKEKNEFSHVTEALEYVAVMLSNVERRMERQRKRQTVRQPFIQRESDY